MFITGVAALYYSFFFYSGGLNAPSYNSSTGAYTFSYTLPTNMTPNGAEGDANWRVFLSLGDGTFWMGTKAQFDTANFIYTTADILPPFVEYTPTYDDNDKPPKKLGLTPPMTMITSTGNPLRVDMLANDAVKLQSTRDPKPTDIITYIITYQHNIPGCPDALSGDLTFTFDTDVLTYLDLDAFNNETEGTLNELNSIGSLKLNFVNLKAGEQRNVFLYFETKDFTYGSISMDVKPKVEFNATRMNSSNHENCRADKLEAITDTAEMTSQQITNSYDPNKKFSAQTKICGNDTLVEFTVTFQNEGPGPTKFVKVLDELDVYLKRELPTIVPSNTFPKPQVYWETTDTDDRTVVFDFPNLKLRGTKEYGYGHLFGEDATMATFSFQCKIEDGYAEHYCNAVINRAKIYFDCNPPIETPLALAPISCLSCTSCSTLADTTLTDSFALGSHILPSVFQAPQHDLYHWYPEEGLSDPLIANPILTDLKHREYTLVASSGSGSSYGLTCVRTVIHVQAKKSCNLQIEVDPFPAGQCFGGSPPNDIIARAVGYEGNPSDLFWQHCHTGDTYHVPYVRNHTRYYFGVTDRSTGCTAELVYTVAEPSPLWVNDIPTDCEANLLIIGGTPNTTAPHYTVNWTYKDNNGNMQSATGYSLHLNGKSEVKAIVTDANGCTAEFWPRKNGCGWKPSWWEILLGITILGVAVYMIQRFLKKK